MIEVLRAGLQCTVQDLGRHGLSHWGIAPSGAADPLLLRAGNLLVGNPETAAAVEITGWGGEYRLLAPLVLSVTSRSTQTVPNNPPGMPWPYRQERACRSGKPARASGAICASLAASPYPRSGAAVPPIFPAAWEAGRDVHCAGVTGCRSAGLPKRSAPCRIARPVWRSPSLWDDPSCG
jgi:hypothetical protein